MTATVAPATSPPTCPDEPTGTLWALLIPADTTRPMSLLHIRDSSAAFSQALGDVLLEDIPTIHAGHRCALYLPDDTTSGLASGTARPDNPRAAVLAARLGLHDRALQARLRGDVLVTGLHPDNDNDQDIPVPVLVTVITHIGPVHGLPPDAPGPDQQD